MAWSTLINLIAVAIVYIGLHVAKVLLDIALAGFLLDFHLVQDLSLKRFEGFRRSVHRVIVRMLGNVPEPTPHMAEYLIKTHLQTRSALRGACGAAFQALWGQMQQSPSQI